MDISFKKLVVILFLGFSIVRIVIGFIYGNMRFIDDPVLFFGRSIVYALIFGFVIMKLENQIKIKGLK
jgi:hypothetical protein